MSEASATVLKPKFVLWLALLQQFPAQIFLTIWGALFFGAGFGVLTSASGVFSVGGREIGSFAMSLLFGPFIAGTFFFFATPVVLVGAKFMNYRNTSYRILPDRIDVEEGFLTIQQKRLMLREVREVTLRRGVLQRLAGLGSVYVATYASGGGYGWRPGSMIGGASMFGSGMMFLDLPEYEAVYRALQEIVARPAATPGAEPTTAG